MLEEGRKLGVSWEKLTSNVVAGLLSVTELHVAMNSRDRRLSWEARAALPLSGRKLPSKSAASVDWWQFTMRRSF